TVNSRTRIEFHRLLLSGREGQSLGNCHSITTKRRTENPRGSFIYIILNAYHSHVLQHGSFLEVDVGKGGNVHASPASTALGPPYRASCSCDGPTNESDLMWLLNGENCLYYSGLVGL